MTTISDARAARDQSLTNQLPSRERASRIGWWLAIGITLLIGLGYWAAARLGLALLVQPEGVAVFWPASGLAAGALLLLGRPGILPVGIGVLVGSVAANLMGGRNPSLALAFGCCNAGEALIVAWLIHNQPRSRSPMPFGNLWSALWFFIAAGLAASLMAMLAVAAIEVLGTSTAPVLSIWWAWMASDTTGIVMLAPFLMTLDNLREKPFTRFEATEASLLLVALIVVTSLTFFGRPHAAQMRIPLPNAALFPLLLWSVARCRPVFLAAGIAISAIMIVWATTLGLGHFGSGAVPLRDRVFAAQLTLLATAFCGLALLSTFNQRRSIEAALRLNEERFQKLATAAPGMIYSFRADHEGRFSFPFTSNAIHDLLGFALADLRDDASAGLQRIVADDIGRVMAEIEASRQDLTRFHSEFRYLHAARGEIWIEANSNPVREADGSIIWHGFLQDITPRKQAEARAQWLTGETFHRNYNLMTVVQGVAAKTAQNGDPDQFVETFCKRIDGLAASHDLLVDQGVEGVALMDLTRSQLSHFSGLIGTRIHISGPDFKLKPEVAQTLGMVLHELATNAYKHGALQGETGTVEIAWTVGSTFRMHWSESGGPPAEPPQRQGFGHSVLTKMTPYELGAHVRFDYAKTGIMWQLAAPVQRLQIASAGHAGRPKSRI